MSSTAIQGVPVFSGANFRTWQQQMGDFLKFQELWRIVSGAFTRLAVAVLPNQANLDALAEWDTKDEKAQGILGLRLFPNLRTHLGATSTLSWATLDLAFGQPGISSIYADLQAALHVKISGSQNPLICLQESERCAVH
jgi:hypothetical protein